MCNGIDPKKRRRKKGANIDQKLQKQLVWQTETAQSNRHKKTQQPLNSRTIHIIKSLSINVVHFEFTRAKYSKFFMSFLDNVVPVLPFV
jgi:hypothetical protein